MSKRSSSFARNLGRGACRHGEPSRPLSQKNPPSAFACNVRTACAVRRLRICEWRFGLGWIALALQKHLSGPSDGRQRTATGNCFGRVATHILCTPGRHRGASIALRCRLCCFSVRGTPRTVVLQGIWPGCFPNLYALVARRVRASHAQEGHLSEKAADRRGGKSTNLIDPERGSGPRTQ